MTFPIFANITKASADYPTAATLKIDGNAGAIPPAFQWAQFSAAGKLLCQEVTPLTTSQWADWKDQDDVEYIIQATAQNIGLEVDLFPETQIPIVVEIENSDADAEKEELRIVSVNVLGQVNWERVSVYDPRTPDPSLDSKGEKKIETGQYILTKAQRAEWIGAADSTKIAEFVAAAIAVDIV